MQIVQLTHKSDLSKVENAIRLAYGCHANVPCTALNTASYYLFRKTCENDWRNFTQSDLSVTLPWPDVKLTLSKGFVIVAAQRPSCALQGIRQDTEFQNFNASSIRKRRKIECCGE